MMDKRQQDTATLKTSTDYIRRSEQRAVITVLFICAAALAAFLWSLDLWFMRTYPDLSPEQFLAILEAPFDGMAASETVKGVLYLTLPLTAALFLMIMLCRGLRNTRFYLTFTIIGLILAVGAVFGAGWAFYARYGFISIPLPK